MIKKSSVIISFLLYLFLFTSFVFAQTKAPWVKVQNSSSSQPAQLLVDYSGLGTYTPYIVKGVDYQPTPIGRYPSDWGYAPPDPRTNGRTVTPATFYTLYSPLTSNEETALINNLISNEYINSNVTTTSQFSALSGYSGLMINTGDTNIDAQQQQIYSILKLAGTGAISTTSFNGLSTPLTSAEETTLFNYLSTNGYIGYVETSTFFNLSGPGNLTINTGDTNIDDQQNQIYSIMRYDNFYDDPAILNRDFSLLKQMNVNTIRLWKGNNGGDVYCLKGAIKCSNNARFPNHLTNNTLNIASEYNLKVIPGFWVGALTFNSTNTFNSNNPIGSTDDNGHPINGDTIISNFATFVSTFAGNKAILFWAIGNENNFSIDLSPQQLQYWYNLVNAMAKAAHLAEDPTYITTGAANWAGPYNFHPVAVVNGEIAEIGPNAGDGATDSLLPDLDIWGVNVYRGEYLVTSQDNFFTDYHQLSHKPLWISEFGIDAWDTGNITSPNSCSGSLDETTQAIWDGAMWNDVANNSSVAIGGSVMEYSDEWWQPNEWLCTCNPLINPLITICAGPTYCSYSGANVCTDLTKCTPVQCQSNHSFFGNPYPNFPDGYMNQEWFGLMSISQNTISQDPDKMTQRAASYIWTSASLIVSVSGSGASISSSPAGITNCGTSSGVCASTNFLEFQPVTLTATGTGTTINWGITGCQTVTLTASNPTATCSFAPDANSFTVSVSLNPVITVSAGSNGTISPSGTVTVNSGGSQNFTITPDNGYVIGQVLVDGNVIPLGYHVTILSDGGYALFNGNILSLVGIKADHAVSASFAQLVAPVIITQPISQAIAIGNSVTFTCAASGFPIPTYQWQVSTNGGTTYSPISGATSPSYTISSTSISNNGTEYECVATNTQGSATSNAAMLNITYTVSFSSVGSGSITCSSNGNNCSPLCSMVGRQMICAMSSQINAGASATFTATPFSGSAFAGWGSDACASVGTTSNVCTVTINSNTSVTANFTPVYTITANGGSNGTISPSGNVSVNSGASQTFIITPNPGYLAFYAVDGGGSVPGGVYTSYVFSNVTAAHTISATFVPVYTITTSIGPNGTMSPTYISQILGGSNETFWFTPNNGYSAYVSVDRATPAAVTGNSYTLSNITANHTVAASFVVTPPTVPANVIANPTVTTNHIVKLSWTASISNIGIAGYTIVHNGTVVAKTPNTAWEDVHLNAGTNTYQVFAYDKVGNKSGLSKTVQVTRATFPKIEHQPISLDVPIKILRNGYAGSFSVTATGVPLPTYQWYASNADANKEDMAPISGAIKSTYIFSIPANVKRSTNFIMFFKCKITNAAGSVETKVVTLKAK